VAVGCYKPLGHSGNTVTFTTDEENHEYLEVCCTARAGYRVTMSGVEMVSSVRTIECYSSSEGYLCSCRGTQVNDVDGSQGSNGTLYHSTVMFDQPVSDLTFKVCYHY